MRACATADTVRYGTERATGNELLKRPINARQGTLSLTKIIETNEVRVTEMHKMLEPEQQLGDYRSTRVSVLSTAHGEKMQWCGGRRWGGKQAREKSPLQKASYSKQNCQLRQEQSCLIEYSNGTVAYLLACSALMTCIGHRCFLFVFCPLVADVIDEKIWGN